MERVGIGMVEGDKQEYARYDALYSSMGHYDWELTMQSVQSTADWMVGWRKTRRCGESKASLAVDPSMRQASQSTSLF